MEETSIRVNGELGSNETDVSDSHADKHDDPRMSTRGGIRLIEEIKMKMHWIQFALIVNWIQMKLM
jgi:hypothetical protein